MCYIARYATKKNVDGLCDVMVRAEDASKINRIVERFKLATVDTASIKQEIANTRSEKQPDESQTAQTPELNGEAPEREGSPPSVTEEVREDFFWTNCWERPNSRRRFGQQASNRKPRLRNRLPRQPHLRPTNECSSRHRCPLPRCRREERWNRPFRPCLSPGTASTT